MSLFLAVAASALLQAAESNQPVQAQGTTAPQYVFFDFGRPVLTRDAEGVLDVVIEEARKLPVARIELAGFSDAAGPAAANQAISRQRAKIVAAYLEAHGIRRSDMAVKALGEGDLLIPTADGVREPQNRRVEVRVVR